MAAKDKAKKTHRVFDFTFNLQVQWEDRILDVSRVICGIIFFYIP